MRQYPEMMLIKEKRELMNLRNRVRSQREEIKRLNKIISELKGRPEICGFCGGYNVGTCSTCEVDHES